VKLVAAISYRDNAYPGMKGNTVVYKDSSVIFACNEGFIECEIKN
jgi:hypothetical protein